MISTNDVLLSLKRLQKVPDDVRMQKVLQVLDTDEDGLIDITDVLRVSISSSVVVLAQADKNGQHEMGMFFSR